MITLACDKRGAISKFAYPEVEQQVYNARYSIFAKIPSPRYAPYEQFVAYTQRDNENDFDFLLREAKANFLRATQRIAKLIALDEDQRNVIMLP